MKKLSLHFGTANICGANYKDQNLYLFYSNGNAWYEVVSKGNVHHHFTRNYNDLRLPFYKLTISFMIELYNHVLSNNKTKLIKFENCFYSV